MARGVEARAAMGRQSRSPVCNSTSRPTETRGYLYRSLFVQTRGVLKKELTAQLRTRRQMRHAKGGKAKNGQGHILVSIRERSAEAEDRAVPGHWAGRSSYRSKRHAYRDTRRASRPLYDACQ